MSSEFEDEEATAALKTSIEAVLEKARSGPLWSVDELITSKNEYLELERDLREYVKNLDRMLTPAAALGIHSRLELCLRAQREFQTLIDEAGAPAGHERSFNFDAASEAFEQSTVILSCSCGASARICLSCWVAEGVSFKLACGLLFSNRYDPAQLEVLRGQVEESRDQNAKLAAEVRMLVPHLFREPTPEERRAGMKLVKADDESDET